MKKMYENTVKLQKLSDPYQMQQLIAIVFARNRERDPSLLALAAEGRMYARSLKNGS
jgi:LysR family malonate utilization transcriptional regulator